MTFKPKKAEKFTFVKASDLITQVSVKKTGEGQRPSSKAKAPDGKPSK